MAGLFVMLRFIKKRVAPAQFESRLYSTLAKAVTYITYSTTLEANAYVSPYKYYLSWYIPDADIAKYGIPISLSILGEMAVPVPNSLVYADDLKKYRCTAIAMSAKVTATVVFLKL